MSERESLKGVVSNEGNDTEHDQVLKDRHNVRLMTVFGGRICQYGKAYECIISDVSMGGAKVKLKDVDNFHKFGMTNPAQLTFERLSDYKALNAEIAWLKKEENIVGLKFTDPEIRRRIVIKRLMPNRWRLANTEQDSHENSEDLE